MSLKIVVRTRMPDTNSSSGTFVAYSSPPSQEVDVFPPLCYGSYMILVPRELPRADKLTPRLVTMRGRAQWLLGVLVDDIPLPQQLVDDVTSEGKASEMRAVLEQYLAGYMDSEIEEFIKSIELGEYEYGKWFQEKRKLLKWYINLLENPTENGLPEGIPHPAKVVIRISKEHTNDVYYPAGSVPMEVKTPPGWVVGSFPPGDDEGYIKLEYGQIVPHGKMFDEKWKEMEYLKRVRHRILASSLPAELFVAEVLRGYLAPEYLPDMLLDPHPLLSPAEPVNETTRLFCISAGAETLKAVKQKLRKFTRETRVNGILRSATLFCPSQWLSSGEEEIDEKKTESMKKSTISFLCKFAPTCGMSVLIPLDVTIRTSHDDRFCLSLLCSTSLFQPIVSAVY